MSLYPRPDSPYWWIKYEKDPVTKLAPRKPRSTGIYRDGGSKAQTAQNKADAIAMWQADCTAIRKGEFAQTLKKKPRKLFRDYGVEWLRTESCNNRGTHSEQSMVAKLTTGIVPAVNGHPERPLGDYWLDEIDDIVIKAWRTERVKRVKPTTVNRNCAVLAVMLKNAKAYINSNPLAGRDEYGERRFVKLKRSGERDTRAFSRDEFDRFIAAIEAADAIEGISQLQGLALAYSAVETLLRRSSLLTLTWSLYRTTHLVPLDPKVVGSIKRSPVTANMQHHFDQWASTTPHDYIFSDFWASSKESPWQRPSRCPDDPRVRLATAGAHVYLWFNAVCARAHVPVTRAKHGVTFHSFRHTGATWLLAAGYSVKVVMELGGWTDANVFIKTYCHTSDKEVDAAANSLFGAPKPHFPRAVAQQA